ncbi:DUF2207 domain-containing protein [Granulicoccus phenolivorans]|uniref:DUF2207 domain-containing protein n=1 Tax=Granulicoccus phenolivorans TaxID=266854 RepID=UPI00040BDD39|nr:DUF2207 domain-containing protein [Granulicoccus phenolivorans]
MALFAALAILAATAAPARAEGTVADYSADIRINADGSVNVEAKITFDGTPPGTLVQRFQLREQIVGSRERVYRLEDVRATANGQNIAQVDTRNNETVVTMTPNGAGEITLNYTVHGAAVVDNEQARPEDRQTLVAWNVLQGLDAPVNTFTGEISIPGQFSNLACVAGPPGSTTSCTAATGAPHDGPRPTFEDGPRGAGEIVGFRLTFPPTVVAVNADTKDQWTLQRALKASGVELAVAGAVLLLGLLAVYLLHRRNGRDAALSGDPTPVAEFRENSDGTIEFHALGNVVPGQVGTVFDERVDPVDVTGTILDLAVRGYLRIVELPRADRFAPTDWEFVRLDKDDADLYAFERDLLNAIAPAGEPTRVSEIGGRVAEAVPKVQDDLYDQIVENGWYERRPDSTRNAWATGAWVTLIVAIVITGILMAFTTFGLTGLALIAVALFLAFVATSMPKRTPAGTRLLAGLMALQQDLLTRPTDKMPKGLEYRELSEVLPYAVVLGGADRWLTALVAADDDPGVADPEDLDWYHGPADWHLQDLPTSLENFRTTLSGVLFRR